MRGCMYVVCGVHVQLPLLYSLSWPWTSEIIFLAKHKADFASFLLCIIILLGISLDPIVVGIILACVEVARRTMWNCLRLENEHLNNVNAMKAVHLPGNSFIKVTVSVRCHRNLWICVCVGILLSLGADQCMNGGFAWHFFFNSHWHDCRQWQLDSNDKDRTHQRCAQNTITCNWHYYFGFKKNCSTEKAHFLCHTKECA